jgi:N-methylhydantoinase B/oxoprolinase/acetone carboxylase alpha subunit
MAGFRIDINDGRNAPVAPLEPPGGASLPPTAAAPQANSEVATAQTIGDVVTGGTQDWVESTYDAASRTVTLTLDTGRLRRRIFLGA